MSTSKKEFISEAEDLLESAQGLVLGIQESVENGAVNPESVNALFRDMHTIKGLSGLFGLQGITKLSHKLESLLDNLRLGKIDASIDLCDFLLRNIDILRTLVRDLKGDKVEDVSEFIKDIEDFAGSAGKNETEIDLSGVIDDSVLKVLSEYEEHRLKANIAQGNNVFSLKVEFPLENFDTMLAELSEKIKVYGELLSTLPVSEAVTPGNLGFNLLIGSELSKEEMSGDVGHDLEVLSSPETHRRTEKKIELSAGSLKSISSTVRVDIEKLDKILNTLGELNLSKGAVMRIGQELFERFGYEPLVIDTYKMAQLLSKWVSMLQEQILDIRMIPIGQIFSRLAQVIRRYSRKSGKKINLHMFGEDTNIDKYLAEEAIDPLMHVVRNAIDHGLENAEERISKGKSEGGTITLSAFQRGNHVMVEVTDDGRGIDMAAVKKKALEQGLIKAGDECTEKEIRELIFLPGFSTSEKVTEVSGRGVGMDVVKEKISSLGGFVSVESETDKGTTTAITLPITLAIFKALMVKVGTERFAIPLASISESFKVEDEMLQTIEGRPVVNLRGELLPVVSTGEIFDITHDAEGNKFIVVVGFDERKMGLQVDELFGQHEIVIKSMGKYFEGLKGIAGATEIGKHEIILVLDVETVIDSALVKHKERAHV
ncbi:chemotaxis protein CheA [bacterium BMS3Abin07]|nr:chemotaxis protein CheA [bacterium BMS3Abin07]HDL21094.1 chemotaxis protein CheA [Nitrospirota bacterium]HDZ87919.1 chemotaxis protein CheA [Nitrospirota bacterium]